MSSGSYREVHVLNGKDNGEPQWMRVGTFEDQDRMISIAKSKSKKNPEDVFLASHSMGYSTKTFREWYFIAGEMVCFRQKISPHNWTGDTLPVFPDQTEIKVYDLILDEVEGTVSYRDRGSYYSKSAVRAAYVGRGWRYNRTQIRADILADGTSLFFSDGKEVPSHKEVIDAWNAKRDYEDRMIVPKSAWAINIVHSKVEFRLSMFQRDDLNSVVNTFGYLDEMVQNMSDLSVHQKEAMADIARVLHIAVEDIKKYASMEREG